MKQACKAWALCLWQQELLQGSLDTLLHEGHV